MNFRTKLMRVAVITCFALLLSGFVAYRSGAFDYLFAEKRTRENNLPTETDFQNSLQTPAIDSPPPPMPVIISGSKSGAIITLKNDSMLKRPPDSSIVKRSMMKIDSKATRTQTFTGSKSGSIFKASDVMLLDIKDTARKQRQ